MNARNATPLILLTLITTVTAAEESVQGGNEGPQPMTAIDLIEMPSASAPRLSPDGRAIAYTLSEANWEENKRISHIWSVEVSTGESRQLTFGAKGERGARWSPDGKWLTFLTERGDDEHAQVYALPTGGGEAKRLTTHETAVSRVTWAESSESFYFLASDPKAKDEKARDKRKDDVFAYDENFQQRHLWQYNLKTGETERLTEGSFSVSGFNLGSNDRIALHVAPTPRFDDSDESEIRVMSKGGKIGGQLTSNRINERGAHLSASGEEIVFVAGANADWESYFSGNLFVVPSAGGSARLLVPDLPHDLQTAEWTPDGQLIAVANTGARSQLFKIDPKTDEVQQLTKGDHRLGGWHYRPELDLHVVQLNTPTNPGDFYLIENGKMRQVSRIFDDLAERFRIPKQELVEWKGADGVTVEGLVTFPLDYVAGQRYPLAVQTHGGPAASDKFGFGRWNSYPQVLAARGWMVLKPNYRGSTGYGDDFLRDMVGHYYKQSHLDVMTGVDALIERGMVDPDRLVKMGWSAGGHMTNKIITHTNRFKAASSGAGAVNWISMYGQSDVRIYRTPWFGGTPWEEDAPIATYWEHSPLKDIWKVKTPTLVLVGENDVRVPAAQSIELFRALQSHDVESHLYMAPREGHGWRELRHQLFKVNVELDWFERHALGRSYEWEEAPGDGEEPEPEISQPETAAGG